jgi:hypothetical protein
MADETTSGDSLKKDFQDLGKDLGEDAKKDGIELGEKMGLDAGEDLIEGKSADDLAKDEGKDVEDEAVKLFTELKPDLKDIANHIPEPALAMLTEGGNMLLKGLSKYGAKELQALEAKVETSATFIAVHNKLTQAVAGLEALFLKD